MIRMPGSLADIRLLLATDRFVVIDKPSGILSVPGKGEANQACAASWVKEHFPRATGPIVVHRLDMDTSGLLVFALDAATQRFLSGEFEKLRVEKVYTALVEGHVTQLHGTIDVPIRADIENRPRQIVDHVSGRPSQTRWRVLAHRLDHTRLELIPLTGRTHQLRVHCAYPGHAGLLGSRPDAPPASRGHPILGDVLYGDPASAPRLMLHAHLIRFTNPTTRDRITVTSTPPF
jgi:tRNA pseudouridine32 synthase / 23S rRNA pseudouridine746 synthase